MVHKSKLSQRGNHVEFIAVFRCVIQVQNARSKPAGCDAGGLGSTVILPVRLAGTRFRHHIMGGPGLDATKTIG